jgi:hypothetical protein
MRLLAQPHDNTEDARLIYSMVRDYSFFNILFRNDPYMDETKLL